MPALYELANEAAHLQQVIADADGEITPEVEAALEALGDDIRAKLNNIGHVIAEAESEAAFYKVEMDRLGKNHIRCVNTVRRLKDYSKRAMEMIGEKSIKTDLFAFSICRNGTPSVEVPDISLLPDDFVRVKREANCTAIIAAYKEGIPLPDGVTVEVGTHLRIR